MLRYNVIIVGKFFNKDSCASEAWRKDRSEEFEEPDGHPERVACADEWRLKPRLDLDSESVVCAVVGHATSTRRSVDARWKGPTNVPNAQTNQQTN